MPRLTPPVLGEGVPEVVGDHAVERGKGLSRPVGRPLVVLGSGEEGGGLLVGVGAVEVVGVDDREGLAHDPAGGADGVGGSPGLAPALGGGEALREVVEALEGEGGFGFSLELGEDLGAEVVLEVLADDEDDLAEAGADGVVDGVVEDGLAVGAHGVELLEAAVAAAHAGGEDEEGGRVHCFCRVAEVWRRGAVFTTTKGPKASRTKEWTAIPRSPLPCVGALAGC